MCRYALSKNASGAEVRTHTGICQNAIWFDRHDDTVFLCRHPENDTDKAPTFTATLSLAAWDEIDRMMNQEANAS